MTHTYVVLEVSKACYDEIAKKLKEAGYDCEHNGEIDMHGVALAVEVE